MKDLYNAHEEKLLAGRPAVNTDGMDEAAAREAVKADYEERRSIMDADPVHVSIAGRMMFKRVMGKASFANIQDLKGSIQIYVARDAIGEDLYATFKKSDIGDIWGVKGYAFRTKTGEISIHAEEMTLLSKSLQILPEKFHGLTDTDMRYRQRYIDLIMNQESKEVFVKRSKILKEIRNFLADRDFMEVETPMLVANAGGAAARPFETHYNALNEDVKLRISLELYRTGRREGASDAGDGQPVGHARKRQRRAERQQGKYRRDADAPELDFGQYGRRAGGRKGQFADGDRQHRQVFDRAGRELRALLVDDRQSGPVLAAADRGRHRLAVARPAYDAGRIESDRGPHQRGERHGGSIDERSAALRVVGDGERQSGGVARRFEGSPQAVCSFLALRSQGQGREGENKRGGDLGGRLAAGGPIARCCRYKRLSDDDLSCEFRRENRFRPHPRAGDGALFHPFGESEAGGGGFLDLGR